MWWFTENDGVLCLGTEPRILASLVVVTDIALDYVVKREATKDEIKFLGARPSTQKVQTLAKRIFIKEMW